MLISVCTAFTACNDDAEDSPVLASNKLNITVGLQQPQGRAIITGTTLPESSSIGVLLDDGEATSYDAYNNIKFTAATENSKQVWNPASDIVLDETKGTLYAYYPYAAGTNLAAIPVETASQTDYLYAEPVANVSEKNANVSVTMKHMLANVNVTVNKGTYVGTGNISKISIQSDGIATAGTFNAAQENPAFTATTGAGTAIESTAATTLGGTATDIMVVPTGAAKPITFMVRVDDVDYTVTSSDVTLESGYSYEYTLSLNSTFMSVNKVAVTEWNSVTKEHLTLTKPGEAKDFENHVKLTYTVADSQTPVMLMCDPSLADGEGLDLSTIDEIIVQEQGMDDAIVITPSYTYQFTTAGEHTVYVKFKDVTQIPYAAFAIAEQLKSVYIPNTVTNIGSAAFVGTGLTGELVIPNSVTTIGEQAFYCCEKLASLKLGSGMQTIGEWAFYGCKGLTSLTLGTSVKTIGDLAFGECRGLTGELVIPNSVTTIGEQAFSVCKGLTSLIIGSGVQTIEYGAFLACVNLETITSLAIEAPSVNSSFDGKTYGTLYYPIGSDYSSWKDDIMLEEWSFVEQ